MELLTIDEKTILSLASGATTPTEITARVKKWRDGTAQDLQDFQETPDYTKYPWIATDLQEAVAACDSALAKFEDIVTGLICRGHLTIENGSFEIVSPGGGSSS